jgi:hypothetical protein
VAGLPPESYERKIFGIAKLAWVVSRDIGNDWKTVTFKILIITLFVLVWTVTSLIAIKRKARLVVVLSLVMAALFILHPVSFI